MGTAVDPPGDLPSPWDTLGDVDVFVDEVPAELTAMARDGTRPQRSGGQAAAGQSGVAQGSDDNLVRLFRGMRWRP